MAVLSTLAVRPDHPYRSDAPSVYTIENELFVVFGTMSPTQFWEHVTRRRFVHPLDKEFSLHLDYASPDLPHDPWIPGLLLDEGDDNQESDPLEFVLNDYDDAHLCEVPNGHRILRDWKDEYFSLLNRLDKCVFAILNEFPREGLPPAGHELVAGNADDCLLDVVRTHRSYHSVSEVLWKLKGTARNNLGLLTWLTLSQSWWKKVLPEEDQAFVRSLNLPLRPKRGCIINPISDWSYINIPLFRQHDVPFAYVWSEAVNAQPRFARLDAKFINGYFWMKEELGREPRPEEIPAIANGERYALDYDHLLQNKKRRTKNSPARQFDPRQTYLLQMHEGWKSKTLTNADTIQNCLDAYESYERERGDGSTCVVIEGWSMRGARDSTVGATFELGPVASQNPESDKLSEREDLTVYERRELYRLGCAPWGGAEYDAVTGELKEVVDLSEKTALADLERLLYPREPELDVSLPPPGLDEHDRTSEDGMNEDVGEALTPLSSTSLLHRLARSPRQTATPAPSTHASWRTETRSDVPSLEEGRRSASPRRGVKRPEMDANLAMPDPTRINRSNVATPGMANWGQRLRLFQASFVPLLESLSPRPYPRFDDDFFDLVWEENFQKFGYLIFPVEEDRLRFMVWAETQEFERPLELLKLGLVAGIRIHIGYRTDAPLPANAKELAGPRPEYYDDDYLPFGDGGAELYKAYRGVVQRLCRREHAPSFLAYGGWVSAIAAKYGRGFIKDRLKDGIGITARVHKLGTVEHPYGIENELLVERPSAMDINKLLGMVIGQDGKKKKRYWMYPPPPLWASLWPGSGEWNFEEEQYFLDLYNGWENGEREPWSMRRWKDHLEGLAHSLKSRHADRAKPKMSAGDVRDWVRLFDWVYGVDDGTIAVASLVESFKPKRLPLFR